MIIMIYADQDVNGYVKQIMPAYDAIQSLPENLPAIGNSILSMTQLFVSELAIAGKEFPDNAHRLDIDGIPVEKASLLKDALGDRIDDFARAWYDVVAEAVDDRRCHKVENVMARILELRGMDVEAYRKKNRNPMVNPAASALLREDAEKGLSYM